MVHIHWCKTLEAFENQSLKYAHIDPISDFCILVIPEAIVQAGAFKFSSVGALNTRIKINPGYWNNCKILILLII